MQLSMTLLRMSSLSWTTGRASKPCRGLWSLCSFSGGNCRRSGGSFGGVFSAGISDCSSNNLFKDSSGHFSGVGGHSENCQFVRRASGRVRADEARKQARFGDEKGPIGIGGYFLLVTLF